jgi:hypothetical protein
MAVADKLQIKPGQRVAVLHAPAGVDIGLSEGATDDPAAADAVLLFVTDRAELDERGDELVAAAWRDALAWVAYPKAGQLGTDLNRDTLAELLARQHVRAVRQISIDDVWSALRFRPA